MNQLLNQALRAGAVKLRNLIASGSTEKEVKETKEDILGRIYGFLCSCFGEPPRSFDFEYVDKENKYHEDRNLTPDLFFKKYVGDYLDQFVSVINSPTKDKPFHCTYTIRYLGNVAGGAPVKHLNLKMEEIKQAIVAQLKAGKVVWFGSDVGKYSDRALGIWDDQLFGDELLSGLDLTISKEDALDYGFSAMNHAMVLTGVQLKDGVPVRWKIENSCGNEKGMEGYYICSDSWFNRFVYQVAVEKRFLGDLALLAEQEPIVFEPWDPMGTLAE